MLGDANDPVSDTTSAAYTERLTSEPNLWWKRVLPTQLPYQLHMRSLRLGRTLDVGCGIGRNLCVLPPGSVGVDHNATSVAACRSSGLVAWTSDEFPTSDAARPGHYQSILLAHVLEHVAEPDAITLGEAYLPYLAPSGRVVAICPQERGYDSDRSHVRFVQSGDIAALMRGWGLAVVRSYSFPFPRAAGPYFTYNEFVVIGRHTQTGH